MPTNPALAAPTPTPTSPNTAITSMPPGTTEATKGTSPVSPVGTVEAAQQPSWAAVPIGAFFDCELGAKLETRFKSNEAIDLVWKGKTYPMDRVATSSGAVRLEDKKSGLVWIQIPAKSMLMDAKAGRQLANECQVRK